jgi:hypothetical protein
MFQPGLTNLFELLVIIRASAHPIQVLWNNWMIGLRQCEPIQISSSRVARSVAIARPTCVPALPNCCIAGKSPTITSGPGLVPGSG